jgi:hypothetical protein
MELTQKWEHKLCGPPDFSCIPGYLHKLNYQIWLKHALNFYGHLHLASQFVASFVELIADFNIVYEYIMKGKKFMGMVL